METKHITEFEELEPAKGLGEYIGWVVCTRDVGNRYIPLLDVIMDPMVGPVYMFHG